jgi:hypothetical protein
MIEKSRSSKASPSSEPNVAPPSSHALKQILMRVLLGGGRLTWSGSFKMKCNLRGNGPGFNTQDAMNALRRGKPVSNPTYSASHSAWLYDLADLVEGKQFIITVALDCKEDYQKSPHLTIVAGFFRRGRRKEPKGTCHVTKEQGEHTSPGENG